MKMKTDSILQAIDITDWFIAKANEPMPGAERSETEQHEPVEGISHLKLQKLLYFAQAAHLSLWSKTLFEDEIEAWLYGPVVPTVYQVLQDHGKQPFEKPLSQRYKTVIDAFTDRFLEQVWGIFGYHSARQLVFMTSEHEPWQEAYKKQNRLITTAVLETYYKPLFEDVAKTKSANAE